MRPRILIIEDDEALRNAVQAILEASGYQVAVAGDGAAGSRALTGDTYEVVLLDLGLPFIDGWRILRGLEPGRLPSVIVISARGEERDKVRALEGVDIHILRHRG